MRWSWRSNSTAGRWRDDCATGSRCRSGGSDSIRDPRSQAQHPGGYFAHASICFIVTGAGKDMMIANEETFGPVSALFRFSTEDEAIAMSNDTEFGLAAYFYTRDAARVWRVGEALEYGIVGINEGIISTEVAPFGGVKESGLGREGSRYGIEDFMEIKYMCMGGLSAA